MTLRSDVEHVPLWRHLRAIGLLPGTVTLVVPAVILYRTRAVDVGWSLPSPWSALPVLLGCALIGAGLFLVVKTVSLFHRAGRGTLAPWDPPALLVVRGIYRNVRNPMISGVLCILLGEAALLGSLPLARWFLLFLVLNLLYIPLVEERQLGRRFGAAYLLYRHHVPRWIPRLHPWQPPSAHIDRATLGEKGD